MASRLRSRDLELAVKKMVQTAIGGQLSTTRYMVDGEVVNLPSVILARDTSEDGKVATPPPYPFVMISQTQHQKVATVLDRYLDNPEVDVYDNVAETALVVRVGIKVFGTSKDNVEDICSDLEQSFAIQDYQVLIQAEYKDDCAFTQTSDPLTVAATINNIYQEVSTFDAYFSVVRQHRQQNVGVIHTIEDPEQGILHVDGSTIT